jgi:hypothetical protein
LVALLGVTVLATALVAGASAATVANGDFETGDLTGWTTFVTANGTIGSPTVASFDTTGAGASDAAQFSVGTTVLPPNGNEGGGIYQVVTTSSGSFNLAEAAAAYNPSSFPNNSCGLFELLVDGVVVASHDFGVCDGGATVRTTLTAAGLSLSAGQHEIRVRITRPYGASGGSPLEYVDNVSLTPGGGPSSKDACKNGGWQSFPDFKNQGDCVSFVATGGKNKPTLS